MPPPTEDILQPVAEPELSKEEGEDLIESILRESDVKRVLDKLVNDVCDQQSEQNDVTDDVTDDATIEEILSQVEPTAGITYHVFLYNEGFLLLFKPSSIVVVLLNVHCPEEF